MGGGCPLILAEMDMDDMFWEIPTQEVFQAVKWAIKRAKGDGGKNFFSLAKGNMRQLDWLGASSGKSFMVLSSNEVKQFVEFNVTKCNLLVLGQLILRQGRKGVPIGGFLSIQFGRVKLAELWAL